MCDTGANQEAFPQPRHQEPGLGCAICRMLGIVCLGSGAVLNAAIGRYHGKGGDEQTLPRSILDMLAYNFIRAMMAQAAQLNACSPRELSFKHTVQIWLAWTHYRPGIDEDDKLGVLFVLIGEQRVADRPGRIEPRAIKTRPKLYPRMTQPRELASALVRKHGHPKKLK